jgi:hypothetical protein
MRNTDRKKLWALAGGRCSRCKRHHSDTPLEEAHIVSPKATGPRGTAPLSINHREDYENYILLCTGCHAIIDADVAAFPVEGLKHLKTQHEEFITMNKDEKITEVSGTIDVTAVGGDEATGLRVRKATIVKPDTSVNVNTVGTRRTIGVDIGGGND